jgi:hypothetical protein
MTVTAPPRPPRPSDPVDREEVEALVEALFEEARQRARRRRRVRLAAVACVVLVGATVLAVFERTAESQSSSPALTARSGFAGGKVKVVIAGTGERILPPPTDGSLAGHATFRASGAITDQGTAVTYRTVKGNLATSNAVITLRYVTTGKKGAITFLDKIVVKPTTTTSRWTITSGTKAYKGLHGKGTETENASYTVSTLRGTVWR